MRVCRICATLVCRRCEFIRTAWPDESGPTAANRPCVGANSFAQPGWMNPALPLLIHVEILPRMLPVRVLLVASHPWLNERVLDRVEAEPPRVVCSDDLRHAAIDLVALGAIGQPPRPAI